MPTATVTIIVQPAATLRPWWECVPKPPPEPCPERPTGFVTLDQYDQDFTYPLASSRVPVKEDPIEGCSSCSTVAPD